MFLPSKGIAFRFIAMASNGPSHSTKGESQFMNNSNGIMSLEHSGFLYFTNGSCSNERPVK